MSRRIFSFFPALLASVLLLAAAGPSAHCQTSKPQTQRAEPDLNHLQLKITVGGRAMLAPFVDNKTTRAFIKLLPLTLTLDDLGGREKYSGLPARLPTEEPVPTTYQAGDLSYWLGGGLAAYYHEDGHQIKAGVVVLAKLESNAALFNVPGPVTATFEAVAR